MLNDEPIGAASRISSLRHSSFVILSSFLILVSSFSAAAELTTALDIRSIDVYESGLKGLLGLGTIDFSTAANAGIEVQFKDMRQAHEVKDLVRKLQKGVDPTED